MTPQYFKGDATELKFDAAGEPIMSEIGVQRSLFQNEFDTAAPLGDVIFDDGLSPLSNAIPRDVFRSAFKELFEAFVKVGTFEAYITVFKKIFGDDVVIDFTVPAAGKLNIDVTATTAGLSDFVAREIVDNAYVFDEVIDDEDDNIVFQTLTGLESQYELEQMLKEMVPAGIYTEISLTLS